jgi:hypothetical protein
VLQAIVNQVVKAVQKIEHPPIDARGGVEPTIVFHADVQVGKVEEADFAHSLIIAQRWRLHKRPDQRPVFWKHKLA